MARVWILLFALTGVAAADKMKPGHYPEKAATWKKLTLGDVAIGTELAKLTGFTCDQKRCVKFVDARCAGRPTKLGSFSSTAPKGKACAKDLGSGQTYLDGTYTQLPLEYIWVEGTDTDTPIVHSVEMTLPLQDVSDDAAFVKSTSARLAMQPTNKRYKYAPYSAVWLEGDTQIDIVCAQEVGPRGKYCEAHSHDFKLEEVEKSIQEAWDEDHPGAKKRDAGR